MDRHENLALSAATNAAPPTEDLQEMSERDRESLHRLFRDMRRTATSHHLIAAVPHP